MKVKEVILAVDDNPLNLDILVELLDGYDVLVALNAKDGLGLLKKNNVDLILLDIMMPDMNGFEMAHLIKSNVNLQDIPLLFISAMNDENSIEKGFEVGAMDYVIKPFRPTELKARVRTHLKMYRMYKKVEHFAYYDYLSDARNRRSFFQLAEQIIKDSEYSKLYGVMIDIDKFKNINDTYGHAVGDVVIQSLCKSVQEEISSDILFARLGGEEFALLIPCEEEETVRKLVEKIRVKIEHSVVQHNLMEVMYKISCGISVYTQKNDSIDKLMNIADEALYDAKNEGRNQIKFRK